MFRTLLCPSSGARQYGDDVSILSFRRVHYVVCFLLGISPASEG